MTRPDWCHWAYLTPPWWVTMGLAPPGGLPGQLPVPFQGPPDVQPPTQVIGVAAVAISPPANVTNTGDALNVSVTLTGASPAGTALHATVYQAFDVGSYALVDQTVFLFPQITVSAGSATATFQLTYQKLSPPGHYIVSVVTADEVSQVADLSQLPQTRFASFSVQTPPAPQAPPSGQAVDVASVSIAPPATVTNLSDVLAVSASLTGPAPTDTGLQAIIYQTLDDGTHTLIDQSAFLSSPISVSAGGTIAGFQLKYQKATQPGTYIVSVVTADAASGVTDPAQLPVTAFAPFVIEAPPVTPPPPPPPQPVGVASVTISPPAVTTPGDALSVSVSLTGSAATVTSLYAILYQALDNGTYSPTDQSAFLIPPINVPFGNTSVGFQLTYQKVLPAGNYVVSVVTADQASQVPDLIQLPVTKFAPFAIQNAPQVVDPVLIGGRVLELSWDSAGPSSFGGVTGVAVNAHRRADDTTVATTTTDSGGYFFLPVSPTDLPFDGYLTMTNPQDMFPTRVYVSRPVTGSIQLGNILLGSGDAFDRIYFDLGQIFGLAPIPATVIISVRDSTLAEVQVDGVDVQEAGISVVTFMRDSDALDPSMPTTLGTSGKSYWLLNVPPGSAEVSATSHGAWQVDTAQISVIESELIFVLLIADPLPSGQTQPQTPPPPSPPSPSEGQDITVGGQPTALAFDGSNVWIATQTDNSVWVLSANDGSHLATFPITGTPYAMVSTANSTWIGSAEAPGQGYLTQANSSGIIRTFALQQEPMALTAVP